MSFLVDGVLVDMSFGTGAVKVTPAHDPNDYICGKRNNLDFIVVLSEDGKIAPIGGKFAGSVCCVESRIEKYQPSLFPGLMRYDARISMEQELDSLGLLRGKEVGN